MGNVIGNAARDRRRTEMVDALKAFADVEGPDVTMTAFCRYAGCWDSLVYRLFASWGDVREAAGLARRVNRRSSCVHTRDSLLAALAEVVKQFGPSVTLSAFERTAGISEKLIRRVFGSWRAFRKAAGLPEPSRRVDPAHWSPDKVQALVRETLSQEGGQLTQDEFCKRTDISENTVYRHGGWVRIRRKLGYFDRGRRPWLDEDDPLLLAGPLFKWDMPLFPAGLDDGVPRRVLEN